MLAGVTIGFCLIDTGIACVALMLALAVGATQQWPASMAMTFGLCFAFWILTRSLLGATVAHVLIERSSAREAFVHGFRMLRGQRLASVESRGPLILPALAALGLVSIRGASTPLPIIAATMMACVVVSFDSMIEVGWHDLLQPQVDVPRLLNAFE
jgi:hypothetical protein